MSSPFIGEIRIFPFTYAPVYWAMCQGGTLPINQNPAMFSLFGTTYGGNGTTNFGLPNLSGGVPVGIGQGTGLSTYVLGQTGGATSVTLNQQSLAGHTHPLAADQGTANSASPSGAYYATGTYDDDDTPASVSSYHVGAPNTTMSPTAVGIAGGGQSHNNMMPYLTLNFCIALVGEYPQRP